MTCMLPDLQQLISAVPFFFHVPEQLLSPPTFFLILILRLLKCTLFPRVFFFFHADFPRIYLAELRVQSDCVHTCTHSCLQQRLLHHILNHLEYTALFIMDSHHNQ